jgi:hypothetical protein
MDNTRWIAHKSEQVAQSHQHSYKKGMCVALIVAQELVGFLTRIFSSNFSILETKDGLDACFSKNENI